MFRFLIKLLLFLPLSGLVAFWIISFRLGGVVPEDFVNSKITTAELSPDTWQTYGATEWALLAQKMIQEKQFVQAEQAAKTALSIDPSHGGAIGVLIPLYGNKQDTKNASYLIGLGERLWPAKYRQLMQKYAQQQKSTP